MRHQSHYLVRLTEVVVVTTASLVLVTTLASGYQQPVATDEAVPLAAIYSNDDIYRKLEDIDRKLMTMSISQPIAAGGCAIPSWEWSAVYDAVAGPFSDLDQIGDDVRKVCTEVGAFGL